MKIGCVILAGGKSSRMGTDKALLEWKGRTFLEQLAGEMDFFEEKWIVGEKRRLKTELSWNAAEDIYPDCGPIGGMQTSLSLCQSEALFVVSCDTPLMKRSVYELLYEAYREDEYDAVISVTGDGKYHPLCGIYRKTVGELFEQQIQKGQNKIMASFEKIRVKYVAIPFFMEVQLKNINTPMEYEELLRRAGEL